MRHTTPFRCGSPQMTSQALGPLLHSMVSAGGSCIQQCCFVVHTKHTRGSVSARSIRRRLPRSDTESWPADTPQLPFYIVRSSSYGCRRSAMCEAV
jgi:hypothetical protein